MKPPSPSIPGFEILGRIGGGGQGTVWRARQKSLDRVVAIKVLSESEAGDRAEARRFLEEARLASQLLHPNIVQGIDVGVHAGQLYFVMEFVSGEDAKQHLRERGPLREELVLDIGHQVGQALAFAAGRGVVHGDIKPENLVIAHDGTVKVVDFGIAGLMRGPLRNVAGTTGFIAPEILAGRRGDGRSDLFGLGVTLFELSTGIVPECDEPPERALDVRRHRPEISDDTARLVARLLAPRPADRFPDAASFLEALAAIPAFRARATRQVRSPPASVSPRTRWAVVAILGAVLLAALAFAFRTGRTESRDPADPVPRGAGTGAPAPTEAAPPVTEPAAATPTVAREPSEDRRDPASPIEGAAAESPTLEFETSEATTYEGATLEVPLVAEHLPAALDPVFEVRDAQGRDISHALTMPRLVRDPARDDRVVVRWEVPWTTGHDEVTRIIVARQGVLQVKLRVRIAPRNRPPVAPEDLPIVTLIEGGEPKLVVLDVTDEDGDPVTFSVPDPPASVSVTPTPEGLRVAAARRPGHEVIESSLPVVARDAAGAELRLEVPLRVDDVDLPTMIVLNAPKEFRLAFGAETEAPVHVVSGPRGTMLRLGIDLADPDDPTGEALEAALHAIPEPPRGARIKRRSPGAFVLEIPAERNAAFGPTPLALDIGETGHAPRRVTLHLQRLERITPPRTPRQPLDRALDWLRRHQRADGAIAVVAADVAAVCRGTPCSGHASAVYAEGITALAVVAALRAGDGSPWVRRAVAFLVARQDAEGCVGSRQNHNFTYNHSIACEALATACHLLGDPTLREPARRGLLFLDACRNPEPGRGWRYGVRPNESDASVTTWALRALLAGRMAGIPVSRDALAGGFGFLDAMTDDATSRTGYTRIGERPARPDDLLATFLPELSESLTAGAVSVLLHSQTHPAPDTRLAQGLNLVFSCPPAWSLEGSRVPATLHARIPEAMKERIAQLSPRDFYYWQHATAAIRGWTFKVGKPRPPSSWRQLDAILKRHQRKDACASGSYDPVGLWGPNGGRAYTTAILALTLANLEGPTPLVGEFAE